MTIQYPIQPASKRAQAIWLMIVLAGVYYMETLGGGARLTLVPDMFLDGLTVEGHWKYFAITILVGGGAAFLILWRRTPLRLVFGAIMIWLTTLVFVYQTMILTPYGR